MEVDKGHQHERSILFHVKLYEMLEDMELQGQESIVSWLPHGKAFKVHQPKVFAASIMPKYFKQSMYKSFQRQLYMYGFCRITSNHTKDAKIFGAYFHPSFIRGYKQRTLSMSTTRRSRRKQRGEGEGGGCATRRRTTQQDRGEGMKELHYSNDRSRLLLHENRGMEGDRLQRDQQKEIDACSSVITNMNNCVNHGKRTVEPDFHFSMLKSLHPTSFYLCPTTPAVPQEVTEEGSGSTQDVGFGPSPSSTVLDHQYEQSQRLLVDSRNEITVSPTGGGSADNDSEQELSDFFSNMISTTSTLSADQFNGGRRGSEHDMFDLFASSLYQITKNSKMSRNIVAQEENESNPCNLLVQLLSDDAGVAAGQQGTGISMTNATSNTSGVSINMTPSSSLSLSLPYASGSRQSPVSQFLRQQQQKQHQQSLLQKYHLNTKSTRENLAMTDGTPEDGLIGTKTAQATSTTETAMASTIPRFDKRNHSNIKVKMNTTCWGFEGKMFYSIEDEKIDFILC